MTQKATQCMIPIAGSVQDRQVHGNRRWTHDCQGLGGMERLRQTAKGMGCLLGVMQVFRQRAVKYKSAQPCKYTKKPLDGTFLNGELGTC